MLARVLDVCDTKMKEKASRCLAYATEAATVSSMTEREKTPPPQVQVAIRPDGSSLLSQMPQRSSVIIGRGADCDVIIGDTKASRHHCKLTREKDGFLLEDLESKNGTFVEGSRVDGPVHLKPHQAFKVGDTVFYLA